LFLNATRFVVSPNIKERERERERERESYIKISSFSSRMQIHVGTIHTSFVQEKILGRASTTMVNNFIGIAF